MDQLKQLFESALLNDESRTVIREAFDAAVKAKEVELKAEFEVQLAEATKETLEQLPAMVEEALAEELAVIAEEVAHARTLEVQYADKLNVFKEDYDQRQQEQLGVLIAEAVAEEFDELREDIELAKRHEFSMQIFEQFKNTYEQLFGGVDVTVAESIKADRAELDKYKRAEKLATILECVTGEKRKIAETILENVATDNLDAKFESIRSILLAESTAEKKDGEENGDGKDGKEDGKDKDQDVNESAINGKVILENQEQDNDSKINAEANEKLLKSLKIGRR